MLTAGAEPPLGHAADVATRLLFGELDAIQIGERASQWLFAHDPGAGLEAGDAQIDVGARWRADLDDVRALFLEHLGRVLVTARDAVAFLKISEAGWIGIDRGDQLQPVAQRGD